MININKIKNEYTVHYLSEYNYYSNLQLYYSESIHMQYTGSVYTHFKKIDDNNNIDCILMIASPLTIYEFPPEKRVIIDSLHAAINSKQYTEEFLKSEFKNFDFNNYKILTYG